MEPPQNAIEILLLLGTTLLLLGVRLLLLGAMLELLGVMLLLLCCWLELLTVTLLLLATLELLCCCELLLDVATLLEDGLTHGSAPTHSLLDELSVPADEDELPFASVLDDDNGVSSLLELLPDELELSSAELLDGLMQ